MIEQPEKFKPFKLPEEEEKDILELRGRVDDFLKRLQKLQERVAERRKKIDDDITKHEKKSNGVYDEDIADLLINMQAELFEVENQLSMFDKINNEKSAELQKIDEKLDEVRGLMIKNRLN